MGNMSTSDLLLLAAVALPLLLALAAIKPWVRRRADVLLLLAPLPGLVAALAVPVGQSLLVVPPPFRLTFALDMPGAVLLGGAALLWLAAGLYAVFYLKDDPARGTFCVWWLLTLAGSFAVFLVADVASFYLAYALVSFSAYGLATHDDTPEARRAGRVYLALTVLGEALLIAAFVMLASSVTDANPLIRDAVAGLSASPWKEAILLLLLVGFTMKMGLFPLHVWMPLAHAVAPVPGSAVLSGIVVKAGVIGLIRFLPWGESWPDWGAGLLAVGLFTAFYGVAIGLTQRHPKRALAYSTVSQMGVVAAVLGMGLKAGDGAVPALAAFYAVNHMLLKGAMFLTVGVVAETPRGRLLPVLAVAALLGLSLAGLPFTGGALAKYAVKAPMGDGLAAFLLALSAGGTTLLMARHVLLLLDVAQEGGRCARSPRAAGALGRAQPGGGAAAVRPVHAGDGALPRHALQPRYAHQGAVAGGAGPCSGRADLPEAPQILGGAAGRHPGGGGALGRALCPRARQRRAAGHGAAPLVHGGAGGGDAGVRAGLCDGRGGLLPAHHAIGSLSRTGRRTRHRRSRHKARALPHSWNG